jgi:benzoate-CoA ligase family protein
VEEQRVLVVLPDSPEYVYAFLGAIWTGAVPVLVNASLRPADYEPFLRETRARVMVTTAAIAGSVGHERGAAAILGVAPGRRGSFWDAIAAESADAEPFATHPDDPAFWLYSSGTTGRPKGVVHLHRSMPYAIASYGREILAIGPGDVVHATSKLFFAYGLGASLYFPLAAGASVVLRPEPFAAPRTWKVLAEERPTLFFAVPSIYRALLDQAPPDAAAILAGVRCLVSAGEALPEAIFREWSERFGQEILDGLGSTEALHIFLSNRPGDSTPGTLGRPVPGYEVRIVDENGAPVSKGTVGALEVRGGSIAERYWQRADESRRAFRGGWCATGDQAVENEAGIFRVLGRTDDMLKVSGQWVSPLEVEAVIAAVEGVGECAVVGRAAGSGLTELVACIVAPSSAADDLRSRVESACADRLPRFKRPRQVVFVEALPRTATGKIQRFALRERIRQLR